MSADTTTNDTDFISDNDRKRAEHAKEVVSRAQVAFNTAQAAVDAADGACIAAPDDEAFAAARAARRGLDDAARDLQLAQSHAAKVAGEISAAKRAAVRVEIDRLEKARGEFGVFDDSLREMAVMIGVLSAQIVEQISPRQAARMAAQPAIDALLRRIGEPTPSFNGDEQKILAELVGLAVAAQGTSRGFLERVARSGDSASSYAAAYEDQARAIAARVTSKRSAQEKGSGIVAKVAAMIGVAALALGLAQG